MLYRIVTPYFVAGVIVRNGKIVEAAPILNWSRGRSIKSLENWCSKKRFSITLLDQNERLT